MDQSHFDEAYQSCYLGRTLETEYRDYIIILTNQERFDSQDYRSETPVIQESIFEYIEILASPVQYKYLIENTILEHDANLAISIPGLTENEIELFSVVAAGTQPKIFEDFF